VSCPQIRALLDVEARPAAKLVLLALALRAGSDGRAWPSVGRLCADTGLSNASVRRALQSLAQAGHLGVDHRPGRSLLVTVTALNLSGVVRSNRAVPRSKSTKSALTVSGRSKKEVIQEVATTVSTAMRPAVASNGNGPAPGESWGEYRERGGR
jgi:DNA-binding transcriptional regulator YhcF (GntR family)